MTNNHHDLNARVEQGKPRSEECARRVELLGTHKIGAAVSFSELELKRIDRTVGELCRHHSPPEHADELRVTCVVEGNSVSMYEERPPWRGEGEWTRYGIALPLLPLAQ